MTGPKDAIDRNLLALLSTEARLSTSEIARRLGVARSTVNERILRLEQCGTILGYQAVVARDEDGTEARAFVELSIDRCRSAIVVEQLRGFPEIVECQSISGEFDLMCSVQAPCAEDIDALMDDLVALDGVRDGKATMVFASKFDRHATAPARLRRSLSLVG